MIDRTPTTAELLAWLRSHRFVPWCPICRAPRYSINCRAFFHFGVRGYDYERDQPIYAHEVDR